jgi:hypothetical protein
VNGGYFKRRIQLTSGLQNRFLAQMKWLTFYAILGYLISVSGPHFFITERIFSSNKALGSELGESKSDTLNQGFKPLEYHGPAMGKTPVLSSGDFQVFLEAKIIKAGPRDETQTKVIFSEKNIAKFIWTAPFGFSDNFTIRILELDQSNQEPEVLIESFTGGASCCFEVMALTKQNNVWKKAVLPPLLETHLTVAKDDGGVSALVTADGRFIGRFDCMACSYAPSKIYRLKNDEFKDVTKDPKYLHVHLDDLKKMNSWFDSPQYYGANGFFAGYVATMAVLGRYKEAKRIMEKNYDRKNDIGLKSCLKPVRFDNCQTKDIVKQTYPEALQDFLIESGLID